MEILTVIKMGFQFHHQHTLNIVSCEHRLQVRARTEGEDHVSQKCVSVAMDSKVMCVGLSEMRLLNDVNTEMCLSFHG